jgi:hypothetical protein
MKFCPCGCIKIQESVTYPTKGICMDLRSIYDQNSIYTDSKSPTFCWVLFRIMEAMASEMHDGVRIKMG